jgi:hypothetical protein
MLVVYVMLYAGMGLSKALMRRAALAMILLLACAVPDALAQHTVSGAAFDAAGAPLKGSVLLIVSRRSTAAPWKPLSTTVNSDGTFTLTNVPPGEYVVQALGARGLGGPAEFGVEQVSVTDRDPRPVTIRTSAGAVLEGLITVEGQPQSRAATVSLVAVPFDVDRAPEIGQSTLAIYRDGRFYLTGLYGRARLVLSTTSEGWYVKSATINGVDASHRGFDFGLAQETFREALIQISHATGVISGRVAGESGGPAGGCAVVVFSTDRERWFPTSSYLKRAQSSPDGSFRVGGLPPGDYYVAAVDPEQSGDSGDWQEPEALHALTSAARRVTLGGGEPFVTELRLIRR